MWRSLYLYWIVPALLSLAPQTKLCKGTEVTVFLPEQLTTETATILQRQTSTGTGQAVRMRGLKGWAWFSQVGGERWEHSRWRLWAKAWIWDQENHYMLTLAWLEERFPILLSWADWQFVHLWEVGLQCFTLPPTVILQVQLVPTLGHLCTPALSCQVWHVLTVGVIVLLVVSWSVCSDQDLSGLGRLVSTSVGNRHGEEPWLLAEHNWSLGEMQSIPGFSGTGCKVC